MPLGVTFIYLKKFFFWNWAAEVACIFLRLVVCQLLHLLLFSPIQKAVFSPCLYFPLLSRSLFWNIISQWMWTEIGKSSSLTGFISVIKMFSSRELSLVIRSPENRGRVIAAVLLLQITFGWADDDKEIIIKLENKI